jgi:hypothetical protein
MVSEQAEGKRKAGAGEEGREDAQEGKGVWRSKDKPGYNVAAPTAGTGLESPPKAPVPSPTVLRVIGKSQGLQALCCTRKRRSVLMWLVRIVTLFPGHSTYHLHTFTLPS